MIRDAIEADIPAITAIYNQAVRETTAIWNGTEVDAADRLRWWQDRLSAGYPVIVVEAAGAVAGYGTYGPFRPHEGFAQTVEHSVYVAPGHQGAGFGGMLLDALIVRARADDRHIMIAAIEAGNAASLALHTRRGFIQTGLLPEAGRKFDRWLDLALLYLPL